jgi:hypothetical protein
MAVGMATALEIHREPDPQRVAPIEIEMRRRLFWTCYLLDRFMACGSKRPSLISDGIIMLRLPSWMPSTSSDFIDGEFFQSGSNLQHFQGSGKKPQGGTGMLIDITRILGITNRYLAAGGVRGDSHFPWHSLSNLSKIRHDLDLWASGTDNVFSSIKTLFGHSDSTILVLSKLVYHLIHCLIYRPFLPIDLSELTGSGQHESWQIEATNMCFLHANAIAELIELGKQTSTIEWPAFVGYCICTAGTVHIHGAHYSKQGTNGGMSVFSSSAHFLNREMQHLSELRYAWASVQHHRETLQGIYNAHNELVKSLTGSMRFAPSFHLEDFFDRYLNIGGIGGQSFHFDAANLSLSDAVIDFTADTYSGYDLYAPRAGDEMERPAMKRRNTSSSMRKRPDVRAIESTSATPIARNSNYPGLAPQPSPSMLGAITATTQRLGTDQAQNVGMVDDASVEGQAMSTVTAATGFAVPGNPSAAGGQGIPPLSAGPFSPQYNFGSMANQATMNDSQTSFDPMFGTLPTNAFSSPAAWHGDDGQGKQPQVPAVVRAAQSPGTQSNKGSPGTAQGDEKDPFLSLLEQLAENEQRFNNGTSELDFFLSGGNPGST